VPSVRLGVLATALAAGLLVAPASAFPSPGPLARHDANGAVPLVPVARAVELPRSPELTVSTRLADRRAVVIGHRLYSTFTEDGLYPAMGFHTRGEMGGFWTPPVKLLDGVWFRVGGRWLGAGIKAEQFASGWGYTRIRYASANGLTVNRTDVAPDGPRAGLIGLTFTSPTAVRVPLALDAHSELMKSYPWGDTVPSQSDVNRPDKGSVRGDALVFTEHAGATSPLGAHDWAAVVGSSLSPVGRSLGPDYRGPQDPAVVCPPSSDPDATVPDRCDDSAYGAGTGGQLRYSVRVPANTPETVWFTVAGSDHGVDDARSTYQRVSDRPLALLRAKVASRRQVAHRTSVSLPGDRLLQRSISWSKQNLADSVQESRNLDLRVTHAGTVYPPAQGHLARAHWIGAGWPDYPWIFGTDGEFTAFASVAMGQFADIEAHLTTLRDVSDIVNHRSGKVVHEVTPDGAVYFGANADEGNTDETAKFPSAVALIWRWTGDNAFRDRMYGFTRRNMHYIVDKLDSDHDGWPEGLGNVERSGMGEEKLDNTVYTIRGLNDLADMARSKGDQATAAWAASHARQLEQRFEDAWWYGRDGARGYADSLDDPGNHKVFQRHWIGLTPMDAMLQGTGGAQRPLASYRHAVIALNQRERPCYTGRFGLYHTGTGGTSDPAGNPGATCDSVESAIPSERNVFSLNTAIMAVAEGNLGRLGRDQQQFYSDGNARIQLGRHVEEMPGAMPEIAPEGDFTPNIDNAFTARSMVLQAWGAYGNLWPVVHQQLGVSPDLGRGRLRVVPQIPTGQHRIAGRNIRLASGSADVAATGSSSRLTTTVDVRLANVRVRLGHVLPTGASVRSVSLDGQQVAVQVQRTSRGREVVVPCGSGSHRLVVLLR
jgi:hypothetical protein